MNTPRFSVIMPVWNTPLEYLAAALQSVVAQGVLSDTEVVIWDDGSDERYHSALTNHISGFAGQLPVKVGWDCCNQGLPTARNAAVGLAEGEWLVLLDSDDLLADGALEAFRRLEPRVRLAYTDHDYVAEDGATLLYRREKHLYHKVFRRWHGTLFDPFNHATFLFHCQVIRRRLFDELGGFCVERRSGEEVDFHLRAGEVCVTDEIVHIPQSLYLYRNQPHSVCHDTVYYKDLIQNISAFLVTAARRRGFDVVEAVRIGRSVDYNAAHYQLIDTSGMPIPVPWFDYRTMRLTVS